MKQLEIYTKNYCPYCHRAKELLGIKGISFIEYDITKDSNIENQMRQRTGLHSVPQIFVSAQYIGDCDDLFALDEQGRLDLLLEQEIMT